MIRESRTGHSDNGPGTSSGTECLQTPGIYHSFSYVGSTRFFIIYVTTSSTNGTDSSPNYLVSCRVSQSKVNYDGKRGANVPNRGTVTPTSTGKLGAKRVHSTSRASTSTPTFY